MEIIEEHLGTMPFDLAYSSLLQLFTRENSSRKMQLIWTFAKTIDSRQLMRIGNVFQVATTTDQFHRVVYYVGQVWLDEYQLQLVM